MTARPEPVEGNQGVKASVGIILAEPWIDNFTMRGLGWWRFPLSESR